VKTFSVQLHPLGKTIRVRQDTALLDVLHEYGVEFPCGGKGICGRCRVKVLEGDIECDPLHQVMLETFGLDNTWRLACLSSCQSDLTLEIGQFENVIQSDESSFDFRPGKGLGIAFDLGTTTLVGQLIDLSTGKILAVEKAMNPQKKFGSDLISRLEASIKNSPKEMTRMIREKIGEMVGLMMAEKEKQLERMVIVGNTVMHHFFCGFDTTPLSFYPFDTPHLGKVQLSTEELGWKHLKCNHIEFYPALGSFVGSDILAGILATGMNRKDSYSVLIDLGTNGEIVVGNREQLLCASTAAGPAFEGANISQGMQATTGAISSISPEEEGWTCHVIGNTRSKGICGSGLIDAVHIFIERGLMGAFGEIESGETEIKLDSRVSLTQKDIQEFQLAKAAISTGIQILLNKRGLDYSQIDDVYISGGFGSYINLNNVIQTGMLKCPVEKIHQMGNSALMGAKMFLFGDMYNPQKILRIAEHVSLEAESDFQDIFVDHLSF
jgi:uncharacterized 2Fe-2S/4Fe-4S cluster protein (DUF4445 family)